MATQSDILAWEIPWTEEPGGIQSMESGRVRNDLATKQQLSTRASSLSPAFSQVLIETESGTI